jgi:hypothetical protein
MTGPTVAKIQRGLIYAYHAYRNSQNVRETGVYAQATADALLDSSGAPDWS